MLNCNASMTHEDFANVVDNELDPGDIVAHHGLSVHGSSQNRSGELRTTYIIQYAAAGAFAYTAPVIDSRHRNCLVRGEPARYARLEAGSVELPPDFSAGYSGIFQPDRGSDVSEPRERGDARQVRATSSSSPCCSRSNLRKS